MSRGLYSDPFLKALLEKEPKLAKEFLELIANTEYVRESEVISCIDVPGWVLEKVGVFACANPNFPADVFNTFMEDYELTSKNLWTIFSSPHLNQEHINQLMLSTDDNIRGLAFIHPLGDSSKLLSFLEQMLAKNNLAFNSIYHICQNAVLSDEIFSFLFNAPDFHGTAKLIGESLWKNPTLSDEQKAALILSNIQPKDESASAYWYEDVHFVSSLPYFQSLRVNLGHYKSQKFQAVPTIKESIVEFFSKEGHHLSLVLPETPQVPIEPTLYGLHELVSLELFHRLFWTDLCERDDFEIYRRNAYRTDDLFISHDILGREFDETAADEATKIGGVIYCSNQSWISGEEELSVDRAAALLSSYGEPMVTLLEDGNYESIGQFLISLSYELGGTYDKKYGFEVTDSAYDWMVDAALEIAEPDDFEVSAELNPMFDETLSWAKLPDSKKETVFEFLSLGFNYRDSKLRNDSIHFLGCMALHEETPKSILEKLAKLNDPLVDEVLASR
jgi:hypothetical protein